MIRFGVAMAAVTAALMAPGAASGAGLEELLDPIAVAASACRPTARAEPASPLAGRALDPAWLDATPDLMPGLGGGSFAVTTGSPGAQAYFDQGLKLTWAFNHAEAARAFRAAQRQDPACAMCYWGEAYALGPNINAGMAPEALAPARAAAAKALALAEAASPHERALIEALDRRYGPDGVTGAPFAAAMRAAAERFPDDDDIATLAAEALMDQQPWDYWQPGGRESKGEGATIVALLERVLARDPAHIGAIHLYIHAVEASAEPARAEPYADRLADLTPAAGHLVHMPSHIYYRIGRYRDSLQVNLDAMAADEAYLGRARAAGIYPYMYYPHNVHFALQSAQLLGDARAALRAADALPRALSPDVAAALPITQVIATAPYTAHALFSPPAAILALPEPDPRTPLVQVVRYYARAVAHARRGDTASARTELASLAAAERDETLAALDATGLPARSIAAIARHVATGRIAQSEARFDAAVEAFAGAVALQDTLPYMEPPFWHYPVRQSLGAALLQAGRASEAASTFQRALIDAPHNGWALWGLAQARRAVADVAGAEVAEARLAAQWVGDPALLTLDRL